VTRLNKNTAKKILFFNYVNLNLLLCRFYSEGSGPYSKIKPVAVYKNCRQEKSRILKENRNKVAVYRWVNNVNNKTYIGSSVNLSVRLYKYFSLNHLNEIKSPIHNALLKYGLDKFTFEVLEYCAYGIDPVVREQYYFSMLKPEYNILEYAGSSLGYKHTQTTLEFFKNERKVTEETRKNLSLAATGRVLTEEDKKKISDARKGITLSQETRYKISSAAIALRGIAVLVKNMNTDEELEFTNLTGAAKHIGVSRSAVKKYSDTGKLIQGKYLVRTK